MQSISGPLTTGCFFLQNKKKVERAKKERERQAAREAAPRFIATLTVMHLLHVVSLVWLGTLVPLDSDTRACDTGGLVFFRYGHGWNS